MRDERQKTLSKQGAKNWDVIFSKKEPKVTHVDVHRMQEEFVNDIKGEEDGK